MIKNHPDVVRFLEQISHQLYTEDNAENITAEMEDHLSCLTEEYIQMNYSEEEAIHKALSQMGNPSEIGLAFNDPKLIRKRHRQLSALKTSSVVCFLTAFWFIYWLGDFDLASGIKAYIAHPIGLRGIVDALFHNEHSLFVTNFFNVFNMCNLIFISMAVTNRKHKSKKLDMDMTPVMVLWSVKQKFKWEYLGIAVVLSPMILLMFLPLAFEIKDGHLILELSLIALTLTMGIILAFTSEKFRIPKYVILNEGFLVYGELITWTAIDQYRWGKDYTKVDYYNLSLLTNERRPLCKTIKIGSKQKRFVDTLLRKRVG